MREAIDEGRIALVIRHLPTARVRDADMLSVFSCLIDNAVRHGRRDGRSIEVDAVLLGSNWVISIKDDGPGISRDRWDAIFDGGSLSRCRRIVESHGGRMWVNSAPARGATFYFSLPA